MVRPMVTSTKHYVQSSLRTITALTSESIVLVEGTRLQDVSGVDDVVQGSSVKAVYIEHWLRTQDTAPGSFVCAIYKAPAGVAVFSTGGIAAMNNADNKKNVLFMSQGLLNDQDSSALSVYRGWIKIPKGKQRMGLGDRIILQTFAQTAGLDLTACGFATYKEYS